MRITNSMVTNNILLSLNQSKFALSVYQGQLASGKKIQKPSDDPIVAVRALKFRTSIREVEQYKSNANDALSWMNVTEKSISNIIEIVKKVRELSVQATSDTLTIDERKSITTSLEQLKEQLASEGNVDYAGRNVFTGFKTDVPLTYTEASTDKYRITEHFSANDVEKIEKIIDGTPPRKEQVSRIRLGYSDVKGTPTPPTDFTIVSMNSTDANAYEPPSVAAPNRTIHFLKDTGELIFNSNDVGSLPPVPTTFDIEYDKEGFKKNDLNPMHYYDCENIDTGVTYADKKDGINYQVSYNQSVPINTLGKDLVTIDLVRDLEEIINEVGKVKDDGSKYDDLLKDSIGDRFNELIGKVDKHKDNLLQQEADLGTRINRLDLTINRLEDDRVNFTDLMSKNEDIDVAEVIMKMKSQEMVYNAALMSSSKVVQTSLLDFIR